MMIRSARAQANRRPMTAATVLFVPPEAGLPSCRVRSRTASLRSGRSISPIQASYRLFIWPTVARWDAGCIAMENLIHFDSLVIVCV